VLELLLVLLLQTGDCIDTMQVEEWGREKGVIPPNSICTEMHDEGERCTHIPDCSRERLVKALRLARAWLTIEPVPVEAVDCSPQPQCDLLDDKYVAKDGD